MRTYGKTQAGVANRSRGRRRTASIIPALLLGLSLGGCDALQHDGLIVVLAQGYQASVIASGRDGFAAPDGLLWKDGRLYVADEGTATIGIWTPATGLRALAGKDLGISTPEDLVMDARGTLFFTDDKSGGLWAVDRDGRGSLIAGSDKGVGATEGIALSPGGDILVGEPEGHRILRVDQSGKVSVFLGPEHKISKPESFAYDGEGNLFIADNSDDILYMRSPDGRVHKVLRNRDGFSPETIWFAGGVLYITDSKNGKLFRYTKDGGLETMAVFGGRLERVSGITTDGAGGIFLSVQTGSEDKPGYILHLQRH